MTENEPEKDLTVKKLEVSEIVKGALTKGLNSGSAGASAMVLEVMGLMWLRTTVSYQVKIRCSWAEMA